MASPHHATDIQQALELRVPYELLRQPLRQRITSQGYQRLCIEFAVMRYHSYTRLPEFLRNSLTEGNYYEMMLQHLQSKLQLYPYLHIRKVVQYTKETPLSYYITMIAELLKKECSYDTLPNFTAVDVLNCIGIGRNQYLELTKEVRSKLRWHINRQYVKEHLPQEMLSSVILPPFWNVFAVEVTSELLKKSALSNEEISFYRNLLKRRTENDNNNSNISSGTGSFVNNNNNDNNSISINSPYACELPYSLLHRLYRKGLICATFNVNPDDQIIVPPLERFVMNRTSDDPSEVLLYRVLATIDNRTSLSLLAQLLMLEEEDVCAAAHIYIRLGLAQVKTIHIPEEITQSLERVHSSWRDEVQNILAEIAAAAAAANYISSSSANISGSIVRSSNDTREFEIIENSSSSSHPARRVALLYDASLTGFLMMTNLSADPTFKQHAVTLFEVGKLSDEMIGSFLEKLEKVDEQREHTLGGEAANYIHSVLCLRELLKALREVAGPDGERGVDMLKVESMNELEPTTRYSVLGRNYWSYFIISPVSFAPLIDIALNGVYGSTVSLMPSPWMTLYLYSVMHLGPPSLLLPAGARLPAWPPLLQDSEIKISKLRLQPLTMDAEVTYVEAATSIILVNEMTAMAPMFVQRVANIPLEQTGGFTNMKIGGSNEGVGTSSENSIGFLIESPAYISISFMLPFTASDEEAIELLKIAILEYKKKIEDIHFINLDGSENNNALKSFLDYFHAAVSAMRLQDSLGCFTLHVSFYEVIAKVNQCIETTSTITDTIILEDEVKIGSKLVKEAKKTTSSSSTSTISSKETNVNNELKDKNVKYLYCIDELFVIDIGLGIPLTNRHCCSLMVQHLESLLSETRSESHNDAMRLLARDFGEFLERYSPLTTTAREKMALQSTAVTGPTTQMHIRRLGEGGNGGAPFPSVIIMFDGENISVVDDWNPLVELWDI